jgi:hypothetical protein
MGVDQASSVGVSERIVAARLGVSVDTIRRDRRDGRLGGIPFMKLGEGRRGVVRYDLDDVERFVAEKKRAGRAPPRVAAHQQPGHERPVEQPEQPVEPLGAEPDLGEPTVPLMPRAPAQPRTMWDALAEHACGDNPPADPFAAAGRSAPRRQGSGYWGH